MRPIDIRHAGVRLLAVLLLACLSWCLLGGTLYGVDWKNRSSPTLIPRGHFGFSLWEVEDSYDRPRSHSYARNLRHLEEIDDPFPPDAVTRYREISTARAALLGALILGMIGALAVAVLNRPGQRIRAIGLIASSSVVAASLLFFLWQARWSLEAIWPHARSWAVSESVWSWGGAAFLAIGGCGVVLLGSVLLLIRERVGA